MLKALMSFLVQHIRSGEYARRPQPLDLAPGQLAVNYNSESTGLFFRTDSGDLVKAGPVHVGPSAPPQINWTERSIGEMWLDTTDPLAPSMKVYTAAGWAVVNILNSTITTNKIVNGAVTFDKLADGAVTTEKIVDFAVTNQKVSESAAIASSKLSYSSPAAPTIARTAQDKFAEYVSVKDFGAKGDGSTDDSQKIQNAIDSLTNGGVVYFPEGTYKVNTAVTITKSNVELNLGKATIDASELTGWTTQGGDTFNNGRNLGAIQAVGSLVLSTTISTSSLPIGTFQFNLTSVSGVRVGDLIYVSTTEPWFSTSTKSLMARIIWISGSTVTIDRPVEYPIDLATYAATVQVIRPVENCTVRGGFIRGGGLIDPSLRNGFGPCGVNFEGCVNASLEDADIRYFQNRAFNIAFCYNSSATGLYFQGHEDTVDPTDPGYTNGPGGLSSFYGLFTGRSHGIVLSNIKGTRVRHLIDGADSSRVTVSNCVTTYTHASAYTTHGGSTDWLFTNCVADQIYHYGMQWRGFNVDLRNCFFYSANQDGGLYGFTDIAGNLTDPPKRVSILNSVITGGTRALFLRGNSEVDIRGCKFIQSGTGTDGGPIQIGCKNLPQFIFKNNICQSDFSTRAIQIIDGGADGNTLIIADNIFDYVPSGGSYESAIVIQRTSSTILNSALNLIIKGNVLPDTTPTVLTYGHRSGGLFKIEDNSAGSAIAGPLIYNYGLASITSDANGEFTINHGLYTTPAFASLNLRGDSPNGAEVVSVSSTQIVGRLHNGSGGDVPSTAGSIYWEARA